MLLVPVIDNGRFQTGTKLPMQFQPRRWLLGVADPTAGAGDRHLAYLDDLGTRLREFGDLGPIEHAPDLGCEVNLTGWAVRGTDLDDLVRMRHDLPLVLRVAGGRAVFLPGRVCWAIGFLIL
jgi:hypothetical protein